ncbi:MAG: hypothetical protein K0R36_1069 [Chryseobacterium sp.]|jgi:hypothetical protein|nr:hypothetical protein [Chryseobacterium sp.]
MKKLVLVASILVTGFVSAENGSSKNDNKKNSQNENKIILNTTTKNQTTKGACVTYTSECGVVAQTCATEGKSLMDLIQWANNIEANYCAPNAPYSNTSGLN